MSNSTPKAASKKGTRLGCTATILGIECSVPTWWWLLTERVLYYLGRTATRETDATASAECAKSTHEIPDRKWLLQWATSCGEARYEELVVPTLDNLSAS